MDEQTVEQSYFKRTLHRLRHEKKIKKLTEIQTRHKSNSSSSREAKLMSDRYEKSIGNNISVFLKSINNQTMKWLRWTGNATKNDSAGTGVLREKLGVHQNCYTTNDVLEIIAITCLVNFIFWFMIITCVNVFTRNQKISKSDR